MEHEINRILSISQQCAVKATLLSHCSATAIKCLVNSKSCTDSVYQYEISQNFAVLNKDIMELLQQEDTEDESEEYCGMQGTVYQEDCTHGCYALSFRTLRKAGRYKDEIPKPCIGCIIII